MIALHRSLKMLCAVIVCGLALSLFAQAALAQEAAAQSQQATLGTFQVVIDPPVGTFYAKDSSTLAGKGETIDDVAKTFRDHQYARGLVFKSGQQTFVLCVLDVCVISGQCYSTLQSDLAKAAGCEPMDVALHVLHQHDAVRLRGAIPPWWKETSARIVEAATQAAANAKVVTSIGTGVAMVKDAAGNRRILGPDNKVIAVRYARAGVPLKAYPTGLIDPYLDTVVFFGEGKKAIASISFYATHPQTMYGLSNITGDMPGEALRLMNEKYPGVQHIYMTGCAGNITLGKFTVLDLEKDIKTLGGRVFNGMDLAYQQAVTCAQPLTQVAVNAKKFDMPTKARAARAGSQPATAPAGETAPAPATAPATGPAARAFDNSMLIQTLQLNDSILLFMPSEIFVEYQLYAKGLRLGHFVGVAAYGDGKFGYVGTSSTVAEGGYEAGNGRTDPEKIEPALKKAISDMVSPM